MDHKKIQQLLEIIKQASPPPVPPGGRRVMEPEDPALPKHSVKSTAPSKTTSHQGAKSGGNPQIQRMQQTLTNLAEAVSAQINVSQLGADHNQQQQGEAESRNSFNNFIAKTYLRKADAQEFDVDPNKVHQAEKNPAQATRMTSVMDTMARIGNPIKGERFADGVWGFRTDAALHNVVAFASALLQLAQDFELKPQDFTSSDLSKLQEMVPEKSQELPILQKVEAAPLLQQDIQNIHRLYNQIKNQVLENPQYQTFIEGDTPFATYQKEKTQLSPAEQQQISKNWEFPVGKSVLKLSDLTSADQFTNWYNNLQDPQLKNMNAAQLFSFLKQSLQEKGVG